jgi:hypothetical protein
MSSSLIRYTSLDRTAREKDEEVKSKVRKQEETNGCSG